MSIQTDDFGSGRRGPSRASRQADTPESALAGRVVEPGVSSPQEDALERALRPKDLDEYIGQAKAREQLEIFIGAAKKRSEALEQGMAAALRAVSAATATTRGVRRKLGQQLRHHHAAFAEAERQQW